MIEKTVSVTYDTLEELLRREDKMIATFVNYLKRENIYKFTESTILLTESGRYKLLLKSELI